MVFFFDNLDTNLEDTSEFVLQTGSTFIEVFSKLFKKYNNKTFNDKQKDFQLYRRGRYVEFNLVYDRGTLFGLETSGRIESILMSLPPLSSWKYNWSPDKDTEESKLYSFLKPTDWPNNE